MNDADKKPGNTDSKKAPAKRKGILLVLFMVFAIIFFSRHQAVNTIDCDPAVIASNPDIIMLGAWWCSYCYQAKRYFQQNNIHYCEYDMENTIEGKRLYKENGSGAVPILLIGEYRLTGFSEQQVEAALATLKEPAIKE